MRRKPYTVTGIRRLLCIRCGARAETQWQICADRNIYRPICWECDVALNEMVLQFMRYLNVHKMMEQYKKGR